MQKERPIFSNTDRTSYTVVQIKVHFRIIFKILLLTYKAPNGLAPDYIRDLLRFNISGRTLRSSNNRLLDEPRANLKTYGERAFSVAAPRLWNKLPLKNKTFIIRGSFKANLKISLTTASDDESLVWRGSLFQSLGAATEKALSPYVLRFALGSSSNLLFEDLSVRPEMLNRSRSLM